MTKVGFHKIIGQMLFRGSLTLSEITKFSKLSKPTVHHHLQNLIKQGIVVYDNKRGKYVVFINEDLQKQILNCLRKEKTIEKLKEELIKISKKEITEKSSLKLLIKDKEFENKLNDTLESLVQLGLVTEIIDHVLSGTKFKEEYRWALTWKGSTRIGICHICKNEIDSKLSSAVVQTIQTGVAEYGVDVFDTMLIHPKCAIRSTEKYVASETGITSHSIDLCNYCGLPFSKKRLQKQLKSTHGKTSFEVLYNLLSLEEIDALSKERRLELISRFKEQFDREPPIGVFDGEVLLKEQFNYKIESKGPNPKVTYGAYYTNTGEYIPHERLFYTIPKSFDFLKIPKFSDLERLEKIIEKYTKRKFDNNRLKELFEDWSKYHTKQEKEIEGMISSILSTPMAKIYPEILTIAPGPWKVVEENLDNLTRYTESLGYSFVIKDEKGNKYHEMCYQHFQNLKPIIQPKSEQVKRGSR